MARPPFKRSLRTLRENQTAAHKYTMETNSHSRVTLKTYVVTIKATVDLVVWNAIANDTDVKSALNAVATIGYSHAIEFYHATSYLLNCISRAYLQSKTTAVSDQAETTGTAGAQAIAADSSQTFAIVFSSSRKYIPGDYLGAHVKPDLHAFASDMPTLAEALKASPKSPFSKLVNFPLNISFGEWKGSVGALGQLLWYLSALKRCRPDLLSAHGMFINSNKELMLVSVNACGSWSSEPVTTGFEEVVDDDVPKGCPPKVTITIPSADTWIAYVVLLYKTHVDRDARFSLVPRDDATALWNVQVPHVKPVIVRPFHTTHCPGRMTWASFVLDLPDSDQSPPASASQSSLAKGFLKTSWQDSYESSPHTETSMLHAAHMYGWVPGLVRHWTASLDPPPPLALHNGLPQFTRRQEFVYLASLGQPLSQCESALHLLKVIYDAVETHLQLTDLGVLHGDISWFNILCNPWHDKDTLRVKPVLENVPCIDLILTGDAEKSQPRALVLDLDHAAIIPQLYSSEDPGREKTGTPMFVSVELSSRSRVKCGSEISLAEVAKRLAVLDEDKYAVIKKRAFPGPDGDHDFMKTLRDIVEKEAKRHANGIKPYTDPDSPHYPHHDVESFYWVLAWGLGRACPLGESPHGTPNDVFSQFVNTMLEHCLGEDGSRSKYIRGEGIEETILHPLLRKHFHPILETLAAYLAVPWHLYVDDVDPGHAHVAMRRALLPVIHSIVEHEIDDVFFNTRQPRTMLLRNSGQDRQTPTGPGTPDIMRASSGRHASSKLRSWKTQTEASSSETPPPSPAQSSTDPATQPLPDPPAKDVPYAAVTESSSIPGQVRLPPRPPRAMRALPKAVISQETSLAAKKAGKKRGADDKEDEPATKRAKTEVDETNVVVTNPRDVETLIKMFWADRRLWFGSGFHGDRDRNAALAAADAQ